MKWFKAATIDTPGSLIMFILMMIGIDGAGIALMIHDLPTCIVTGKMNTGRNILYKMVYDT